jgi:hypothetical protein
MKDVRVALAQTAIQPPARGGRAAPTSPSSTWGRLAR